MSQPVMRRTGASSEVKQRSCTSAEISAANPEVRGASCTMAQRPVLRTLRVTVSTSSGHSVRRSISSGSRPCSAACAQASSASCSMAPQESTVTPRPSRTRRAAPIGTEYSPSGTSPRAARYTRFGSMNSTGSLPRMAEMSRPLASTGLLGQTTCSPPAWMKSASGDCEW